VVRASAIVAAFVLLLAAPRLAEAQQPSREARPKRPASEHPAQAPRPRAEPQRESPKAAPQERPRAAPAEHAAPKSTGEPELKRRKPES